LSDKPSYPFGEIKMTARTIETSPQVYARIGGILYLAIIVAGVLGGILGGASLIVSGDAVSVS
jgi:hypothetical protein